MILPELLIFDFDGTLVDTAPDLIRATNSYLTSKGFAALDENHIRQEIGNGLRRLILDVWPDHEPKDEHLRKRIETEFLEVYDREFLVSPTIFPGLEDFLAEWDRAIAIVSNKRSRYISAILEKLDLDRFSWVSIIGGDTFPNMKPHPEPFLAAMQAAGVMPEETLIIGDGIPDVEGAQAVGSPCLAVEFGYTPIQDLLDLGAFASLESYVDLQAMLQKFPHSASVT